MFRSIGYLLGLLVVSIALVVFGLVLWGVHVTTEGRRWDAKIDALCAAHGGRDVATRVYETVMAPETSYYFATLTPLRSLGKALRER